MKQILLIGPNAVDSAARHRFISSEGFLVTICTKSSDVISNLYLNKFHLIVAEGSVIEQEIDFTIWMAKDPHYAKVPVIFLIDKENNAQSYGEMTARKIYYSMLIKPFLPVQLIRMITLMLPQQAKKLTA